MKLTPGLLAILLATVAAAQTTPPRTTNTPARSGSGTSASRAGAERPPDPNLFDGSKFEKEVRPETGMIGEFEMPGSADSQDNKVGGNPQQGGGGQPPPSGLPAAMPAGASAGAQGAQSQASAAGGAQGAQGGSEGAAGGGSAGAENAGAGGASGAVGGQLDQSKPMSNSGQSGAGGSSGSAEGMAADSLKGGGAAADAAAKAAGQNARTSSGRIGSAELRIETIPDSEKDIVGREAAPGGTQGSNKAMPAGKGGQGSQNQNKGVEKGKVIPKGL